MKTYVLRISKEFMSTHPKKGQPTNFREKILKCGVGFQVAHDSVSGYTVHSRPWPIMMADDIIPKIHTIRENYEYWSRVAMEVNAGRAILSLRQWEGKPYRSKCGQAQEFLHLTKMGVQRATVFKTKDFCYIGGQTCFNQLVSANDGLSHEDFNAWFVKGMDNGAVIHFTDYRYK